MDEKRFVKKVEDFICDNCNTVINGTGYTDHCYKCLYSKHLDVMPGDRKSTCKGIMKPISTSYKNGNYNIYYLCKRCGRKSVVSAAENDNQELLERLIKQE